MSLRALRILLVLVGIAFVGLTAWSLRFFSRYQPLATLTAGYAQPGLGQIGLQAHDVIVVGSEAGRRRWRMTAGNVTFSRDRRSLVVNDIRQGLFYDMHSRPLLSLTARRAAYLTSFGSLGYGYAAVGTLQLDGQVHAVILSPERPALQTQSLLWDSLRNQLLSPGPLTATLPRLSVTAGNAAYDLPVGGITAASRGTLRLDGGIHAIVQSAHGPITLACPGLTWNGVQSAARSRGPVTAQIPGGLGETTAADAQVDTKTGNLIVRGVQGTMRLSHEVL